jgi:ElaB/YqjD/DUF883 family membrane-anchored ribosome-binding protein
MDRTTTMGGNNSPLGASNAIPAAAKVENAAMAAHQTVDKVADKATVQVDRLSGTAHRAVNSAADAAATAADWASNIPAQASKLTEAACTSIRARPIATVAGALVVGYLLGRLARL